MKFSVILLLFLLAGCVGGEQPPSEDNRDTSSQRTPRSYTASEEPEENTAADLPPETPAEVPVYEENGTLGEAVTPLLDNSEARVSNINIACGAINGIAVYPGGTFSFNDTVGRRTEERGYRDAPVIIDGHSEQGCGGGVCQVSTTLYMAASYAGLDIVERHPHSKGVPYAPEGMDATVVSGEKDLRFTNNTDSIITLYTWTDGEEVFSKITKNTP